MIELSLPSVQLDAVSEEVLDATRALLPGTEGETFDLGSGGSFQLITLFGTEVINFSDPLFANLHAATAQEVAAAINSQWAGGYAVTNGAKVDLYSVAYGLAAFVQLNPLGYSVHTIMGWSLAIMQGSDATTQLVVFNRNPGPGEWGIKQTAPIEFNLLWASPSPPFPSDVELTVEGVLAYGSGSWQNGWTGTVTVINTYERHFSAIPPAAYSDSDVVLVTLSSATASFSASWSFTAADYTAPLIYDVKARGKRSLRITFNEPVSMSSSADATSALNPANYFFERQTKPAAEVQAVSVVRLDDCTVDLTTDIELTYGAPYLLVVANVTDLSGNPFVSPSNDYVFDAYSPQLPVGRRFFVADFIPNMNKAEDTTGDLRLTLAVVQEITNVLLSGVDEWPDIFDVDFADAKFLDSLLAGVGNPFPEFLLSEVDKRRLIRLLVPIYKLKGTARGIVDTVRFFLGIETTIEIFNGEGWELGSSLEPTAGDELNSAGTAKRAELTGTKREPFDLGAGAGTFTLTVNGVASPITLTAGDFADPHNATAREVANAVDPQMLTGSVLAVSGRVYARSPTAGSSSSVAVADGTLSASTAFGWPASHTGRDASAEVVLAPSNPASLGPSRSGTYSFRVVATGVLTSEERERITAIAEYMKPAHTHLVDVLDDSPPEAIDHVELGLSELGTALPGGLPGLFILHGPS